MSAYSWSADQSFNNNNNNNNDTTIIIIDWKHPKKFCGAININEPQKIPLLGTAQVLKKGLS